eukprot:scaffold62153_cov61-Phaeocystis_antarctica.AAC.2
MQYLAHALWKTRRYPIVGTVARVTTVMAHALWRTRQCPIVNTVEQSSHTTIVSIAHALWATLLVIPTSDTALHRYS